MEVGIRLGELHRIDDAVTVDEGVRGFREGAETLDVAVAQLADRQFQGTQFEGHAGLQLGL